MVRSSLLCSVLWCCVLNVQATTISYDISNIAGNSWEYTYTVENDTLGVDIEEFTIFFDLGLYQNLAVSATPAGWDAIAIEPDPFLPDDGFYDAFAFGSGITLGDTLAGFGVQFDFLGAGTPGDQLFDIVDPLTFDVLGSGTTQARVAVIPLPPTIWLIGSALGLLFGRQRLLDGN